ncbi:MAG: nucleotidyltransferase family protein [bacterium]|nr:nucleotidyltransferase family protein [bacterium]
MRDEVKSFVIDLIKNGEFDVNFIRNSEYEIFKFSKELGVEQEIFLKIKKSCGSLVYFTLQNDIYKRKLLVYLDFLNSLKKIGNFVLIKGIGIAQKYYGNILGRHIGDVDILVSESDLKRFKEFFRSMNMKSMRRSEIKKRLGHSEQFFNQYVSVGLHSYLCDRFFADIKYEDVEMQKTVLSFSRKSVEVYTLQKEWDLVELSLHAFQHTFALRILLDIYRVLLSKPDFAKVKKICQRFSIERIVKLSVLTSLNLFSKERSLLKDVSSVFNISQLEKFLSSLLSSDFFLLELRNSLYSVPYLDKSLSILLSGNIPVIKILSIMPYIPKEFMRRLKGYYATTR